MFNRHLTRTQVRERAKRRRARLRHMYGVATPAGTRPRETRLPERPWWIPMKRITGLSDMVKKLNFAFNLGSFNPFTEAAREKTRRQREREGK